VLSAITALVAVMPVLIAERDKDSHPRRGRDEDEAG